MAHKFLRFQSLKAPFRSRKLYQDEDPNLRMEVPVGFGGFLLGGHVFWGANTAFLEENSLVDFFWVAKLVRVKFNIMNYSNGLGERSGKSEGNVGQPA